KHYRKDENTVNTAISYYSKGMLVGWLLDARIRCETRGARSLDDVMRQAYARHAGERGYAPDEFEALIAEVAGVSLRPELDAWLRSTEELDYGPALTCFGLRFADPDTKTEETEDEGPAEPEDPPPGWLGAELSIEAGRHVVSSVKRGTPAHDAGIQVADELIAIDGWRIPPDGPDGIWAAVRPGTTVALTLARRGALRTQSATLAAVPSEPWTLQVDPTAPEAAVARRAAWLRSAVDAKTQ
ncbi:MAG: PDZ domain-containing protein, partial [Myxococcota bacterium]|nr:PDZ domain-containing protein [Myxococcota bacterium]